MFKSKLSRATGIGVFLALVGSMLTALPAAASPSLWLAPRAGNSFNMVAGQTLELKSTASSELPLSAWKTLTYKVTNVDGVDANASYGTALGWEYFVDIDGDAGDTFTFAGQPDFNNNGIALHSEDYSVTSHFVVTAWLDANENGTQDSTEYGDTHTVTFFKAADLNVTTSIGGLVYTDDSAVGVSVRINNINNEQATTEFWFNNVDDIVRLDVRDGVGNPLDLDNWVTISAEGYFDFFVEFEPQAAGTIISAQAYLDWGNDAGVDTDGTKIGAPGVTSVLNHSVDYLEFSVEPTVNSRVTSPTTAAVATNDPYQVKLTAYEVIDEGEVALPNQTVSLYFYTYADLNENVTLTVNGVTYTDETKFPGMGPIQAIKTATNSKGQVLLDLKSTGLSADEEVYFTAVAENSKVANFTTVTEARAWVGYITNKHLTTCGECLDYFSERVLEGGSVTVDFESFDQFGKSLPDGWDVRALLQTSDRGAGTSATGASNVIVPIVGGKATFTVKDNGKGIGTNEYRIDMRERDSKTGEYTSWVWVADADILVTDKPADLVAGEFTIQRCCIVDADQDATTGEFSFAGFGSEESPQTLSTGDFGNFKSRSVLGDVPSVNYFEFRVGVGSSATPWYAGAPVLSSQVTLESSGLQLLWNDDAQSVTATGRVVGYTDSQGYAYFAVASHKAGDNVISITSGGITTKLHIWFSSAAPYSASQLTIDAPVWTLPGKAVVISSLLKDKFGNPVSVGVCGGFGPTPVLPCASLNVTGNGINQTIFGTDETGTATTALTLNVNDLAPLKVTAGYDQNGDGDFTDALDLLVTKSVLVQNGALVPADAKVAVSAPASSQNGRAVDVSVTVTTAAGVAIPGALVNLSGLGAGYLSATTATTDANGKVAVKLLAGADEIGDAVVTATAGSVSATAKVSFGTTDANLNIAGKRVTADWSFAAGKRVVIYRDGVQIRNFVVSSDASDSFSFNLTKGKHTVKIKVGGVTIDSQSYNIR